MIVEIYILIHYLRILNLLVSEKVHIFYCHDITEILLKVALNTITLTDIFYIDMFQEL